MTAPTEVSQDVSPLMSVLQERWVLMLATSPQPDPADPDRHVPYPTPLFYALAPADLAGTGPRLVFASRPESTHGRHLGAGPTAVAAGIYLETEAVGQLRGVQLRGHVLRLPPPTPSDHPAAPPAMYRATYLDRHPTAAAMLQPGAREQLYLLAITWAKLTDNRLGFGHKLEWRFAPHLFSPAPEDLAGPRV